MTAQDAEMPDDATLKAMYEALKREAIRWALKSAYSKVRNDQKEKIPAKIHC